jgi:hypothetical protein
MTPPGIETNWTKYKSETKIEEKEVSTKDDGHNAAGCLITVSMQNKLTVKIEMLQEVLKCLVSEFFPVILLLIQTKRCDNQCKYRMCFFPKN